MFQSAARPALPVLLVLVILASCSAPEQIVREAETLESARTMARESGGLIVLDFWKYG